MKKSGRREQIAAASTDERGSWSLACEKKKTKQGAEELELFQPTSIWIKRIIWPQNWFENVSAA